MRTWIIPSVLVLLVAPYAEAAETGNIRGAVTDAKGNIVFPPDYTTCDPNDLDTFPGAASLEVVSTACMRDKDGDGCGRHAHGRHYAPRQPRMSRIR